MAIFCLATDLDDLKARLGRIVVGYTRERKPVTAADLKAEGALTAVLKDALAPNLVQTLKARRPSFTVVLSPTSRTAVTALLRQQRACDWPTTLLRKQALVPT